MGNALYTFDNFNIQLLSFLLLSIVLKRKIFITYFCLLDSAFRGLSKFSQGKPKFNSLCLSLPFGLSFVYFYCIKECAKAQEVSWARPVLQTVPVPSPPSHSLCNTVICLILQEGHLYNLCSGMISV